MRGPWAKPVGSKGIARGAFPSGSCFLAIPCLTLSTYMYVEINFNKRNIPGAYARALVLLKLKKKNRRGGRSYICRYNI